MKKVNTHFFIKKKKKIEFIAYTLAKSKFLYTPFKTLFLA